MIKKIKTKMKTFLKIILFIALFSLGFYVLKNQGPLFFYNNKMLVDDAVGTGWVYSVVGIVFGIFSAFVILTEAERWSNLVDSIKKEVGEINEMWLWSRHLPKSLKDKFEKNIKEILKDIVSGDWGKGEGAQKSSKTEKILDSIHNDICRIPKGNSALITSIHDSFSDFIKYREERIHYVSFRLPKILKYTLIFNDFLIIFLSLLIGIKNINLEYTFMISIATLGYLIYLVVDDLDNPTVKGGWHITTEDYEQLLHKINSSK